MSDSFNKSPKPAKLNWFIIYPSIWLFLGILSSSQFYSVKLYDRADVFWWEAFVVQMPFWILWGLLGIIVGKTIRRFPLEQKKWKRNLLLHFLVSLILAVVHLTLSIFFRWLFLTWQNESVTFERMWFIGFTNNFHINLLIYWAIIGGYSAFDYYNKFNREELVSTQLEKQLKQSQLIALQMQLHPHFLFNTLHSIGILARKNENEQVVEMVADLGDLLRYSLKKQAVQEITLFQEIEFIKKYLLLEQKRFQDRLQLDFDIAAEVQKAQVPNLILQPLVENAIRHGISASSNSCLIEIIAQKQDDNLILQIRNNGYNLSKNEEYKEGVGISNTKARLKNLYGSNQSFEIKNQRNKMVCATLKIPFKIAENLKEESD